MRDAVDVAQREFLQWRLREQRLLGSLGELEEERNRLMDELATVEQQIVYYDSLTRDMKRVYGRPGLSGLLSSLRRS